MHELKLPAVSSESFIPMVSLLGIVINGNIEFGNPQNPEDLTSSESPGSVLQDFHHGTYGNIKGRWVSIAFVASGLVAQLCSHGLHYNEPLYTTPSASEPDCRYLILGVSHDGFNGAGSSPLWTLNGGYVGDAFTKDSIILRFSIGALGSPAPTVNISHPVFLNLFFIQAYRSE